MIFCETITKKLTFGFLLLNFIFEHEGLKFLAVVCSVIEQ
jgi:hypothetical protein